VESESDQKLWRGVPTPKPDANVGKFQGLIGEYGWDHDILYVFEKDHRLNVLIEWFECDRLTQVSYDVFNFPSPGLYDGEKAIFTRDAAGKATQVQVSGVVFRRRPIGGMILRVSKTLKELAYGLLIQIRMVAFRLQGLEEASDFESDVRTAFATRKFLIEAAIGVFENCFPRGYCIKR
jgi:hypothetical protein